MLMVGSVENLGSKAQIGQHKFNSTKIVELTPRGPV